ncbi:MAG: acyltransferase [Verrucomicrobia bacterium]|nr:acyltransferase [Verrucomicrobiota bacterium]
MSVSDGANQSMGTRANAHFGFIDQLRGVAILLVFLCHCTSNFNLAFSFDLYDPLRFLAQVFAGKISVLEVIDFLCFYPCRAGWSGVAVFFVVSGFCIHLSYSQPAKPDLIAFYIRRFFRIYPVYALAVLVFGLWFAYSRLNFDQWQNWVRLGSHLLLCNNLSDLLSGISAAYWTIPVEAQLYVLFPVLLWLVRRYSFAKALWIVGVIQFSLQITTAFAFGLYRLPPFWLTASPFYYWFSWSIGAAVCDAYLKGKPSPLRKTSPWLWLIAAVATSSFAAHEFSFAFFALATASLVARRLSTEAMEESPSLFGRFLRITGTYSYSIYLIHQPIIVAVTETYKHAFAGLESNRWAMFFAALSSWLIIFPVAAVMYYLVERPSISLGKHLLKALSQRFNQRSFGRVAASALAK